MNKTELYGQSGTIRVRTKNNIAFDGRLKISGLMFAVSLILQK